MTSMDALWLHRFAYLAALLDWFPAGVSCITTPERLSHPIHAEREEVVNVTASDCLFWRVRRWTDQGARTSYGCHLLYPNR